MKYRPFGPTGQEVSVIGQGTWYIERGDRSAVVSALQRGLDLGMNHIDTAEMYGNGVAEKVVGQAIAGRRDSVYVVSKVVPSNASKQGTIRACEQTLANLKTDYLDCYLLHWPGQHRLSDTFGAFEQLKKAGKIRSWGVSNFDVSDLDDALAVAGPGQIVCNQVLYHLQERAIEHEVIPWCEANGVTVTAYSPFGHDSFPSTSSAGGRVLAEIGAAHDASPRQVALQFLTRRSSVVTIPKSSSVAHTVENAADLTLTEDEIAQIDEAFPRGPRPHYLPML
jgi:diketogulonate reductase-like aldo/keto reductase